MNILIINRAYGFLKGGGEIFDFNLALSLDKIGHNVTFVTGNKNYSSKLLGKNITFISIPTYNFRKIAYFFQNKNKYIASFFWFLDLYLFELSFFLNFFIKSYKQYKFDIAQTCGVICCYKLIKYFNLPSVCWFPGPPSKFELFRLKKLLKLKKFNIFTHGSPEKSLKNLNLSLNQDYFIIEPGIYVDKIRNAKCDKNELFEKYKIPFSNFIGITVSRLVPIKNLPMLLNSLELLNQKKFDFTWIIIGDGPLRDDLNKMLNDLNLRIKVKMLGALSQEEIYKFFNIADIFVLTSNYENFSIATLEAMAAGLPIIGTKVGFLKELIKESEAGNTINLGDYKALVNLILNLSNSHQKETCKINGQNYVKNLDWSSISSKVEKLYNHTINKK